MERDITLACVSNEVGGPYVGNARWVGVPLADLLNEAGVDPAADQLVSRSVDGFTVGTPTSVVMDGRDAMLAVEMNGEPLPLEHGFPVRMLVPGLYGYVSATKWITELELTTFDAFDPYWIRRGWAEQAPIKTQSRIDTPKPLAKVPAQGAVIAGVAWAQQRGIERVEVRIDEDPWVEAELSAQDTIDTWRQWRYAWNGASAPATTRCRFAPPTRPARRRPPIASSRSRAARRANTNWWSRSREHPTRDFSPGPHAHAGEATGRADPPSRNRKEQGMKIFTKARTAMVAGVRSAGDRLRRVRQRRRHGHRW